MEIISPTRREAEYHELIIDSGKFAKVQEETDIRRLAICAQNTGDELTMKVVLERWNKLHPEDTYTTFSLFYGVEIEE